MKTRSQVRTNGAAFGRLARSLTLPAVLLVSVVTAHAQTYSSDAYSSDTSPPVPTTVSDAVFRSRWVGLQADRQRPRSAEGLLGLPPAQGPFSALENAANALREGLSIGPLEIGLGLGLGWEYSNANSNFQSTTPSDESSFFAAPSLSLKYNREIGPWSVSAAYGGGMTYYMNPNYTSAGSGNQRNPFSQTASLAIGHLGTRHALNLQASGSYGTGLNVVTSENTTTANFAASLDWKYTLTAFTDIGTKMSLNNSLNNFGGTSGNANTNSGNLGSFSAGSYADWFATGKCRLRFDVSAGQSTQTLEQQSDAKRSYVQALVSVKYNFSEKIDIDAGLGARYVEAPQTIAAQYVGLLPVYQIKGTYNPTEKTGLFAEFSLLGTDIMPNFNLGGFWQPRVNTSLSLSVYQNQAFSLTVSQQAQVSRGAVITLSQKFFSKMNVSLSTGWQQTENLSLTTQNGAASQQAGQTYSYGFASATMRWNFIEWAYWQGQLYYATGRNNASGYYNSASGENTPETRATFSFNLTF
ncbi:MAG: hypothetical protein WCQ16_07625 [Verrucomicrobiae bacterium]